MQGTEAAQAACSSLVWMSQWDGFCAKQGLNFALRVSGTSATSYAGFFESNLNWKQRKMRQVQRAIIGMDTAE